MTKCIKRIRDLFECALCKFTFYLLTYLVYNGLSMTLLGLGLTVFRPSVRWATDACKPATTRDSLPPCACMKDSVIS